ncbi:transporter substrate-binding domain-containing protein [Fundidesulfovibrio magnetotacticus]|nr:transporter substrate-binding domain-containing protein [Fundidesulfovibrio magnetotacticus]
MLTNRHALVTPKRRALAAWTVFLAVLLALLASLTPDAAAPARASHRPASITVVIDDNYPPYIFRAEDGRIQGLLPDAWELWSQKTGVKAEVIATDWDKAQQIMRQGGADVIDTIFYNDQRAKLYDFTKPYATLEVPVFHHESVSGITGVESLKGFEVGAKAGDASLAILARAGIAAVREYPSYEALILAAGRGEVKVFTVDKPPALYYLAKYNLSGQFRYAFTLYTGEFHRAVHKGRDDLLALVEGGFAAFTPQEREALDRKWLGTPLTDPRMWRMAAIALGVAAALVLALACFNLALRRRVRAKTAELARLVEELARSEERWQFALEGSDDGVWDWNVINDKVYFSSRWKSQLGYADHEVGDSFDDWRTRVHRDDLDLALEHVREHMEGKRPVISMELRMACRDGSYRWILSRGKVMARTPEGKPLRVLGTHADITARKQAEEALRKALAFNEAILEHSPVGIQVFEPDTGACVLSNRRAAQILGLPPGCTPPPGFGQVGAWDKEDARALAERVMAGEGPLSLDVRPPRPGGRPAVASCTFARVGLADGAFLLVITADVTERARMQEMMIQSEKMLSVGGLAAGMAHEINNPLASMLQSIQVVLRRMEGRGQADEQAARQAGCTLGSVRGYLEAREIPLLLRGAREAGARASAIVADMLDFARRSGAGKEPVSLADILDRALAHCAAECGQTGRCDFARIEILRQYEPGMPPVPCVAGQIEQVAVNVLRNAAQALNDPNRTQEPARIVVSVCSEGGMARIEIQDNGPGMDELQRRKAFDPFFSTKAPGKGTGLGLAVCYFIVTANHSGSIEVESPPGGGARFVIRLPFSISREHSP